MVSDPRFEVETPLSEGEVVSIEQAIGRNLPGSYRDFLKAYGGAFVGGLVDGSDELPILTFFGSKGDKSVLSSLEDHPDLKTEEALPFADCELGNLYILDHADAVHYLNYYGGKTTARKVADSFSDFLQRIVVSEE